MMERLLNCFRCLHYPHDRHQVRVAREGVRERVHEETLVSDGTSVARLASSLTHTRITKENQDD